MAHNNWNVCVYAWSLACAQKSRCANHECSTNWTKEFHLEFGFSRANKQYTQFGVRGWAKATENEKKKQIQIKFFFFYSLINFGMCQRNSALTANTYIFLQRLFKLKSNTIIIPKEKLQPHRKFSLFSSSFSPQKRPEKNELASRKENQRHLKMQLKENNTRTWWLFHGFCQPRSKGWCKKVSVAHLHGNALTTLNNNVKETTRRRRRRLFVAFS